jgi:putative membrane protein
MKQVFKKYKIVFVIFAVIIIPLLYSYFYLYAFWDPYSKLRDLPVAISNEDKGSVINGEQRNLGNQIIDELKSNDSIKWVFTSKSNGEAGLENRKYYAQVVIPEDFSKNISTAVDASKLQGILLYTVNEKRNYLAGQVLNRLTLELKSNITKKITKELTDTLASELKKVPDNLNTLNDGLNKINDGSKTLNEKTGELVTGQGKFNDGLKSLQVGLNSADSGVNQLKDGSKTLTDGLTQFRQSLVLGSSKVNTLANGSRTFKAGLDKTNEGLKQLNSKLNNKADKTTPTFAEGAKQLNDGLKLYSESMSSYSNATNGYVDANNDIAMRLNAYIAANPQVMKDDNIKQIMADYSKMKSTASAAVDKWNSDPNHSKSDATSIMKDTTNYLAASANTLYNKTVPLKDAAALISSSVSSASDGVSKLSQSYTVVDAGVSQVADSMSLAADKSSQLNSGANTLNSGLKSLSTGITKAASGSNELVDNSQKIYDGETELNDGVSKLNSAIGEASGKVGESVNTSKQKVGNLSGIDEYVSEPVILKETKLNGVPDYGTAFAPYFVSLSLWVGALFMFFAIYLDPKVKFKFSNGNKVIEYLYYTIIGLVQAAILAFVLKNILGLTVKNLPLFYFVFTIVALSFVSIMRFLLVQFKDVGKFLAILFLILQLTACGGTFPMELVPKFFQAISAFMPMTYSVNSLREVISGVDYSYLTKNLLVLTGIMVFFFVANIVMALLKKENSEEDYDDDDDVGSIMVTAD